MFPRYLGLAGISLVLAGAGAMGLMWFRRPGKPPPPPPVNLPARVPTEQVLPQIDPRMKGMLAPGAQPAPGLKLDFEAAARNIRRLPVSAFPLLPPAVADLLRKRGCTIPQPEPPGEPVNVIQGKFFQSGESGWAVLCSIAGSSSILVLRNGQDPDPEELAPVEDKQHLQGLGGDSIGYSRQIGPVGRDYIIEHYRAYGGPQPPPIDHQGIDDAFLGKASVVHYRYLGKWMQLQGAD